MHGCATLLRDIDLRKHFTCLCKQVLSTIASIAIKSVIDLKAFPASKLRVYLPTEHKLN